MIIPLTIPYKITEPASLNIFVPIILPSAISNSPFLAAITVIVISGKEVPITTNVIVINLVLTFNVDAKTLALSTTKSLAIIIIMQQTIVKIIDFRAPYKNFMLSDKILSAFLKANGELYRDTDLAKKILSNRQPKQKFTEGLEALKSIDYENFEKILISVKEEIVNFISQKDEISDLEIKEQIGLNAEKIDNLDAYIETIQYNFKLAMNYFEKNLR